MDHLSKSARSWNMSRIHCRDTSPEKQVRRFLYSLGYRYKLYDKTLPGRPDIVLPRYKTVIFVNGCFWHGHGSKRCGIFRLPKSNVAYWEKKISRNIQRDRRNKRSLRRLGWHVLTVWECSLKKGGLHTLSLRLAKIKEASKCFADQAAS